MKHNLWLRRWAYLLPIISAIILALSYQSLLAEDKVPEVYLPFVSAGGIANSGTLIVNNPGPQSTSLGGAVSLDVGVNNPTDEALVFSAVGLPEGVQLDPRTGNLYGAAVKPGTYVIVITVRSADGSIATVTFEWVVGVTENQPPLIQHLDAQTNLLNTPSTLDLVALDAEDDPLTFTAAGLPAGLSIDPATGQISGTPSAVGTSTVTIVVTDPSGGSDSISFDWSITTPDNKAPLLTSPGDQLHAVGDSVDLTVSALDPDGDVITFSVTNLPSGLQMQSDTGQISGTVSAGGRYAVTIVADDGRGGTDKADILWLVSQLNNGAPIVTSPGDQVSVIGGAVTLGIVASDPDDNALMFIADGLPSGLTIDPSSGIISGIVDQAGKSIVTITVMDGSEDMDSISFEWRVTEIAKNQPPVLLAPDAQKNSVSQPLTLTIIASDPDGDRLNFSATDLPNGLTIDATSGTINGTPNTAGQFNPTVTAEDGISGGDSVTFKWDITQSNNGDPTIDNPGNQSTQVGNEVTLSLNASDPDGDTVNLSVANLPPGLTYNSRQQTIMGEATTVGDYAVKVVAEDGNGGSASLTFNWVVTTEPIEPPPSAMTVGIIRVSSNGSAFESDGRRVMLRVERSNAAAELTVNLGVIPNNNPAGVSASTSDYIIRDEAENTVGDSLDFTPGQQAISLTVEAVPDSLVEMPEAAFLRLENGAGYAVDEEKDRERFVIRDDVRAITEDSRLFVAKFGPENGAETTASGVATLHLSHDNSFGQLSVFFSNLTSEETASHIHIDNKGDSGPIVFSIPLGQVVDEQWDIVAAHHLVTNQAMLEQLLRGELYVNVHSANYPSGEIRGNLVLAEGTTEMQPVPPADPIEELTGFDLDRDIARFLAQATFGPTQENFAALKARVAAKNGDRMAAYAEWIDEQMSIASPSLLEFHQAFNPLYRTGVSANLGNRVFGVTEGWFTASTYSKAELRERVGFALSEIFVISVQDGKVRSAPQGPASYYDMLRGGAFGSYEELLRGVSLHPSMGVYLSHLKNQAERRNGAGQILQSPDENYAREIMQLFSIGLLQLHPDGTLKLNEDLDAQRTYDQTDITELARVFTGWGLSKRNPNDGRTKAIAENDSFYFFGHDRNKATYQPGFTHPMKMFEDNGRKPGAGYVKTHDNGAKQVLGVNIPAGLPGEEDFERVLDILAEHPNTAPFISRRLIQRLVTSNPSRGYIYRVSTVWLETGGNLGEVTKAILLDPEARNLANHNHIGHGKKKEPLVHFVSMLRLLKVKSSVAARFPFSVLKNHGFPQAELNKYRAGAQIVAIDWGRMGNRDNTITFYQSPLHAPSVFNWFLPDYAPPGAISGAGLVAPELQLNTENQVVRYYNFFYRFLIPQNLEMGAIRRQDSLVKTVYNIPPFLRAPYMAVMDNNGDGTLSRADGAFADPAAAADASLALVDTLDLYVCGGRLQSQTGLPKNADPRFILADGVYDTLRSLDNTTPQNAAEARDERIKEALFLVSTAPECLLER